MIVCACDFETSSLDPKVDRVVEIGVCLWDTGLRGMLRMTDLLLWDQDFPPIAKEAGEAHGLSKELLSKQGVSPKWAWTHFQDYYVKGADAFLAHNGIQFDRQFYLAECERLDVPAADLPWIDTTTDLPYTDAISTRKLTYLAAEHGFLNPFAHRAIFDVVTMLMIFKEYDAERALWYCQQPMVTLRAMVSYDDRQLAKDRGYRWDAERKYWVKNLRLPDVDQEKHDAGFAIREVGTVREELTRCRQF
jgi:DNA polymerase III subunit epsilon